MGCSHTLKSNNPRLNMEFVSVGLTFLVALLLFVVVSNSYAADVVLDASHVVQTSKFN